MSSQSNYFPEIDYKSRGYKSLDAAPYDMCAHCEKYYEFLHKKGVTSNPFPPSCEKHVSNRLMYLNEDNFNSKEEFENAQVSLDPVTWAKINLGWEARWFQEFALSCTSKKKLYRWGRQIGKSMSMIVENLYEISTRSAITSLVIAPYERQVTKFFDETEKFILSSPFLNSSISRYIKSPSRLELLNGSKMLGFSSSPSSAAGSEKIRGQTPDIIVFDEMDYLDDTDIDAIMAMLVSRPNCKILAASTPGGWVKKFFTYATNKNLGFKEFWFISAESPDYTDQTETFFAEQSGGKDSSEYVHEFLADWGEAEGGVFRSSDITACSESYDMNAIERHPEATYVLGVDWNKNAGVHMVIMEWMDGVLRMVRKYITPEQEYTQMKAVEDIIALNQKWNFKHIFVDRGYGELQVELLRKYATIDRSSRFDTKLHPVHMNQSIEIIDPITGQSVKRPAKPFIVQQTARLLQERAIKIPTSEDTAVTAKKQVQGLIQQMRNFVIEGYSVHGLPRYSQGQDHTLTAFMLACAGFYWKEGDLKSLPYATRIGGVPIVNNPLATVESNVHPDVKSELDKGHHLVKTTKKGGYGTSNKGLARDLDYNRSLTSRKLYNRPKRSQDRDNGQGFNRKNV